MTTMRGYQIVDTFIAGQKLRKSQSFLRGEFRDWLEENDFQHTQEWCVMETIKTKKPVQYVDLSSRLLQSHRRSPKKRLYDLNCINPNLGIYRVVGTPHSVSSASVRVQQRRTVTEMFARYENAVRFNMEPIAQRDPKAASMLEQYLAQNRLAAAACDAKLKFYGEYAEEA